MRAESNFRSNIALQLATQTDNQKDKKRHENEQKHPVEDVAKSQTVVVASHYRTLLHGSSQ